MVVDVPQGYADKHILCVLETNPPVQPRWAFQLHFRSYPRARIEPESLDFGTPERGTNPPRRAATVEVYAGPGERLAKPIAFDAGEGVAVEFLHEPTFGEAPTQIQVATYPISVAITDLSMRDGSNVVPFLVHLDQGPPASASAIWHYDSPVQLSPPLVHFGVLKADESTATREVVLRTKHGASFRLLDARSGSECIQIEPVDGGLPTVASSEHRVRLTFQAGRQAGSSLAISGVAQILIDLPEPGSLDIPWSAFLGRSAELREGVSDSLRAEEGRQR